MKETGRIVKNRGKAATSGPMDRSMKEILKMTTATVMESYTTQMASDSKATGAMDLSTGRVCMCSRAGLSTTLSTPRGKRRVKAN